MAQHKAEAEVLLVTLTIFLVIPSDIFLCLVQNLTAMPYLDQEHALNYFLVDCILQANNIQHEILDIRLALLCGDKLTTVMILMKPLFNMSRPTSPTFKTVLSVPHYNLSAHTFAMHTLSLHQISSIIDLLSSDPVATHDLLTLDQVDQTVLNME